MLAEALKCETFKDFQRAYLAEIKHGYYWHVTHDPNFTIDPSKGPTDMSSMANGSMRPGKLMVTSHLEHWADYYNTDPRTDNKTKNRMFAALIDMSGVPSQKYFQVKRGFGNEFFVDDPSQAKVLGVYPIAKAKSIDKNLHNMLPNSDAELFEIYKKAWLSVGVDKTDDQNNLSQQTEAASSWTYKFSAWQRKPYTGILRYFGPLRLIRFMGRPLIVGNSMKIRNNLAAFGFRWDGNIKIDGTQFGDAPGNCINGGWIGSKDLTPEETNALAGMGVDVSMQSTEFMSFKAQSQTAMPADPDSEQPVQPQPPQQVGAQSEQANLEMIMKLREASSYADTAEVMQEQTKKLIGLMSNPNLTAEQEALKQKFLTFMRSAHKYSFFNTLLMFMQRSDVQMTGGAKNFWATKGRTIKPGEEAIWILAPKTRPRYGSPASRAALTDSYKKQGLPPEEVSKRLNDATKQTVVTGFKDVPVYDIAQTDPIPGWTDPETGEPPYDIAKFHQSYRNQMNDDDEYSRALFIATKRAAEKQKIVIGTQSTGFAGGWSSGGKIMLDEQAKGQSRVATLFHELTHEVLHQGNENREKRRQEKTEKHIIEMEAESTAFLLTQAFEINGDPEWAARYILLWQASPKDVMDRQQNIHKAYSTIFKWIQAELDVIIAENKQASSNGWSYKFGLSHFYRYKY